MGKDRPLTLRVRREQLDKIRELGFKYIDCWELGYERICETERAELEKLVKKYHDLYIHVNTRLENFGNLLENETKELDHLLIWYNKRPNASIDNPAQLDLDTLKLQMKKREIHSFTVDQVLDYWRKNKKQEAH